MKLIGGLAVVAVVCLALSPAAAGLVGQDDQEVQAVANPILETVLTGFNNGNYAVYSKYFDDTLKDAITEKKFLQVRADIRPLGVGVSNCLRAKVDHTVPVDHAKDQLLSPLPDART